MAATSPSIPQLFTELDRFAKDGNYAKAQKIANKILQEKPDDKEAFHCKVIALIHQSFFREAVDVINSAPKKGIEIDLHFEKAYCLYRLNKTQEALDILNAIAEPLQHEKELKAQVLYRLEDYRACLDLYRDLIKNSQDDYGDERETNLAAVIAAASQWGRLKMDDPGLREDTYELCYNSACLSLGQSDVEVAQQKLRRAEELCQRSLQDDPDVAEEEIESEMGVVRTQLAYTYQLQGKNDDAQKLYNQVLKCKPNDLALAAVASNNVITLNKDRDVFDSKKKVKATTADGLEHKLTGTQQRTMAFNRCLLLFYTNQLEACRSLISTLETKYPESDFPCLMRASLLHREKHSDKAVELLKNYAGSHDNTAMNVKLTLVQLYLAQGNIRSACTTLRSIKDLAYKPGVVSALVTLYSHLGDVNTAVEVLDDAVEHAQKNKELMRQSEVLSLMRENVAYKLQHGKAKEAVDMLEKLHKEDPRDVKTLAQLIKAYSRLNLKKAEHYSEKLAPLDTTSQSTPVAVDELEMSLSTMGSRYGRAKVKQEGGDTEMEDLTKDLVVKRRKRKRKRGKLPKNYNSEVDPDPERWIPKRERTYYKGKRQKKGAAVGKGTQGAAAPTEASSSPKTPGSPKPASPPGTPSAGGSSASVVPPRQQQPQAAKKKQRPKKKKGGW
ncbi:signal recognition particle subunit SRP72-like [Orbicella faveolata]|uniref:signal recognition particle subunit SRP72-like n=1 Tax=Orbicella faveolata TaxID=48498 RepID=UPI0009E60CFF|nr:signal recognition particle subunit SRP72-like [Orbicella faveolata]